MVGRAYSYVLRRAGLAFRVEAMSEGTWATLGIVLCATRRCLYCKSEQTWRIRSALLALCEQGRSSGSVLRILVSHCVQMFLIYRPALSIFGHVFRFIVDHEHTVQPFGPFIIAELQVAAGCFLLVCRLDLDPSPHVFCSDASLQGFAVPRTVADRQEVADLCSVREKWRFVAPPAGMAGYVLGQLADACGKRPASSVFFDAQITEFEKERTRRNDQVHAQAALV